MGKVGSLRKRGARYSCQSPVASKPRSIAGRAELAWYTLSRALITGGNAALTPGCILDALIPGGFATGAFAGLTREEGQRDGRDKGTDGTKGRASLQSCGGATLFHFQNWGEAYHASMGAWGRCEPPQSTPASQEARSICLGRSEPRLPSRLCGKTTLAVLRRSRPFSIFLCGVKRPWVWPCHRFHGGGGKDHSQGAA